MSNDFVLSLTVPFEQGATIFANLVYSAREELNLPPVEIRPQDLQRDCTHCGHARNLVVGKCSDEAGHLTRYLDTVMRPEYIAQFYSKEVIAEKENASSRKRKIREEKEKEVDRRVRMCNDAIRDLQDIIHKVSDNKLCSSCHGNGWLDRKDPLSNDLVSCLIERGCSENFAWSVHGHMDTIARAPLVPCFVCNFEGQRECVTGSSDPNFWLDLGYDYDPITHQYSYFAD